MLCLRPQSPSGALGVSDGDSVQLLPCSFSTEGSAQCGKECQWRFVGNGTVENQGANGLCLTHRPPAPTTCGEGSPAADQPFCSPTYGPAQQVSSLLATLTVAEKAALAVVGPDGKTPAVERLSVKEFLWSSNCVHGIDTFDGAPSVTVGPMPIGIGASFDTSLATDLGAATAAEARIVANLSYAAFGGTTTASLACFGPTINVVRDPRFGRVSEQFSEDPGLAGAMAAAVVQGMQHPNASVSSLALAVSAQDFGPGSGPLDGSNSSITTDNRTFVDAYLPPFASVLSSRAAVGLHQAQSVTPTLRAINGVPSSASTWLLQTVLRTEFHSDALVVAAPGAVDGLYTAHGYVNSSLAAVVAAVKAGVQLISSTNTAQSVADIVAAIGDGHISTTELDAMVQRSLLTRALLGEFATKGHENPYAAWNEGDLDSSGHRALVRKAAADSVVLLVNNGELPLRAGRHRRVAVIGPNAESHDPRWGHDTYTHALSGAQTKVVSVLDGVRTAAAGKGMSVEYVDGCVTNTTDGCFCCTPSSSNFADAVALASAADVAVVALGLDATVEAAGIDRSSLELPGVQMDLLEALLKTDTPVVVVLVNGGSVALGGALDQAAAAVEAWYGGEEAGNGLADVLFGDVNPSARLPVTFYSGVEQLPPADSYDMCSGNAAIHADGSGRVRHPPPPNGQSLCRSYRYMHSEAGVKPEFFFGYGLSYSHFMYSKLEVPTHVSACDPLSISFNITNDGGVAGSEVPQVYLYPPSVPGLLVPERTLVFFDKTVIREGETIRVTVTLQPADMSTVHADGSRVVTPGVYRLSVGGHQAEDMRGEKVSNTLSARFFVVKAVGGECRL